MHKIQFAVLIIFCLLISTVAYSQTIITGKVVGISDGDTITVLQNRKQFKIRLYGIDTPEKSQDFGNKAKKFTSSLLYKKQVRVVQEDTDRYGRVVGIVYVGHVCANEEIVKNGFAWVYRKYCKKPFCLDWLEYENDAKESKIGLWRHPNPMPPWDFRKAKRTGSK